MSNNDTIIYTLAPYSISQHLFKVSVTIPEHEAPSLTLTLPAWIPGSYMIRDFAKNIGQLSVDSIAGQPLAVIKLDKQRWQVQTGGQACRLNYVVYAFDFSVRSAYLNDEYGFVNGTSAFLAVDELSASACQLVLTPGDNGHTKSWHAVTSMTPSDTNDTGFGTYWCENYAELIDHPILMGNLLRYSFTHRDIQFELAFNGQPPLDVERIATDLKPILDQHINLFDDQPPIDQYLFMTLLADAGYGGLEHRSSTALMFPRWDLPLIGSAADKSQSYRDFLALCSHEFLHTWHVKRTKPLVFIEPDLSAEVYTNQLWIYEGFTSFYDDLALARSGAITAEQYLEVLGKNITRILRNPGRLKQSTAESSFDAWTRFYQQDANSINHIVSYYTKGGLIALCLDIYIRNQSANQHSLDDVMRILWRDFGKPQKGTPDDVIQTILNNLLGIDVSDFLHSLVYLPGELPLPTMLAHIGVGYHEREMTGVDDVGGTVKSQVGLSSLGANLKAAELGVTVTQVRESSNACQAGLQINDRIIAVASWTVTQQNIIALITAHADQLITLTVVRDGRLLTLDYQAQQQPFDTCYLTLQDAEKFNQWLLRS